MKFCNIYTKIETVEFKKFSNCDFRYRNILRLFKFSWIGKIEKLA